MNWIIWSLTLRSAFWLKIAESTCFPTVLPSDLGPILVKSVHSQSLDELELAKTSLLPNIALQLDGSQSVADVASY